MFLNDALNKFLDRRLDRSAFIIDKAFIVHSN